MRLTLTEYQTTPGVRLSAPQRDSLRELIPSLIVEPTAGGHDLYDLTPGAVVGAVQCGELQIQLRPKLAVSRVLFLLSYALDPKQWRDMSSNFGAAEDLVDAIIPGFARQVRRAVKRGLLQGYRHEEDSLSVVRGRIRFGDQIRHRLGLMPPVEVAFDEFTEDIVENQLLKAAIAQLMFRPIRSEFARRLLRQAEAALRSVTLVHFDPHRLPQVHYTRLNSHYRPAIELAKLILRSTAWDLSGGANEASSFLVNMNEIFEKFVIAALREELRLTPREFPSNARGRAVYLDEACQIGLEPDLSWWINGKCVFVGDVKYKFVKEFLSGDVYQMLAYTTATDLPGGMLIYAAGATEPRVHIIPMAGKAIEVVALDLGLAPDGVLGQIKELAARLRQHRRRVARIG